MRRFPVAIVTPFFLACLTWSATAHAEVPKVDGQPVVALCKIKSLRTVIGNAKLVGSWANQRDLWNTIKGPLSDADLSHFAMDRPAAFACTAGGQFVGFVPTANPPALLDLLEKYLGQKFSAGDKTWKFELPGQSGDSIFVRQGKSVLIFGSDAVSLNSFGRQLALELKNLPAPYLVTARILWDGVPADQRKQLTDQILDGFAPVSQQGLPKATVEFLEKTRKKQQEQLVQSIEDMESITAMIGFEKNHGIVCELDFAGKPGSKMALASQYAATSTRFAGFHLPDSTFTIRMHMGKTNPDESYVGEIAKQLKATKMPKDIRKNLVGVVQEVVDTCKNEGIDFVASGRIFPQHKATAVAAMAVNDSGRFEKMLQDMITANADEAGGPKWSASKLGEIRCYEFWNPNQPVQINGVVGFAQDAVYFAVAPGDPKVQLEKAIAASGKLYGGTEMLPYCEITFAARDSLRIMQESGTDMRFLLNAMGSATGSSQSPAIRLRKAARCVSILAIHWCGRLRP